MDDDLCKVFTHPRAIAAAKARIDPILQTVRERDVIGSWELCAEMSRLTAPVF